MTVTVVPDGARALLADGGVVRIRVLDPSDVDEVLELHRRLSNRDTYLRFFGFARNFLPTIARRITRRLDPQHVALGAYRGDVLVGTAHYETLADPREAEIAFVVDAAVQAHGLGTLLLEHLASVARHRGVRRFVAEVLAENQRTIHMIADAGLSYRMHTDGPEIEIVILLDQDDRYLSAVGERERVSDVASLAAMLRPASVAVVGAGRASGSIGHAVLRKLVDGGYTGTLSAVNPHAEEIAGVRCWPSVADVPGDVELAVVCVPAAAVPDAVEQCGRRGVRAAVVISAGLSGSDLGAQVLESVRRHGMRLVGPNCVGVVNTDPAVRLDATFTRGPVPAGRVGVVTQSGESGSLCWSCWGSSGSACRPWCPPATSMTSAAMTCCCGGSRTQAPTPRCCTWSRSATRASSAVWHGLSPGAGRCSRCGPRTVTSPSRRPHRTPRPGDAGSHSRCLVPAGRRDRGRQRERAGRRARRGDVAAPAGRQSGSCVEQRWRVRRARRRRLRPQRTYPAVTRRRHP
jgi:predicted CoA-binding protein/GNAT superfamily N-acetyltransferase